MIEIITKGSHWDYPKVLDAFGKNQIELGEKLDEILAILKSPSAQHTSDRSPGESTRT